MNNFHKDPPTLQTPHIKYLRQWNMLWTKATKNETTFYTFSMCLMIFMTITHRNF